MADKEIRSVPLGLRIKPSLKQALDKAAADDDRPLASYIEKILTDHLRKRGYLSQPSR